MTLEHKIRAEMERKAKAALLAQYAPYDQTAEFAIGWRDYETGRFYHNPFGSNNVAAQSYDRGAEAAMRWARMCCGDERTQS